MDKDLVVVVVADAVTEFKRIQDLSFRAEDFALCQSETRTRLLIEDIGFCIVFVDLIALLLTLDVGYEAAHCTAVTVEHLQVCSTRQCDQSLKQNSHSNLNFNEL